MFGLRDWEGFCGCLHCWEGWGRFELAVVGWRGFELGVGGLELPVEGRV